MKAVSRRGEDHFISLEHALWLTLSTRSLQTIGAASLPASSVSEGGLNLKPGHGWGRSVRVVSDTGSIGSIYCSIDTDTSICSIMALILSILPSLVLKELNDELK